MARFWQLYYEATHNYQTPLYNFGEIIRIDALEPKACLDLATVPLKSLGIDYADDGALERLLSACGGRANLISTTCNEMLKKLHLTCRSLNLEAVESALNEVRNNGRLDGWVGLGGKRVDDKQDPASALADNARRLLARIIVYSTITKSDGFTLTELFAQLKALEVSASLLSEKVDHALKYLTMAYVLIFDGSCYNYAVPLFRDKARLNDDAEAFLKQDVSEWKSKHME